MTINWRNIVLFTLLAGLIMGIGFVVSWNAALKTLVMGLISAIMAIGVNMQWGYAGLFNVGIMGFVALGGLATVLVGAPPVGEAWAAGGGRMLLALTVAGGTIVAAVLLWRRMAGHKLRGLAMLVLLIVGFLLYRSLFDPARDAIEAVNPAGTGYLGGLGVPVWLSFLAWPIGGLFAAGAAWIVGKTALGLRSDYLAIATLGIAEIILAVIKNEDWLDRGVKNVVGLPRPVPQEINLQSSPAFLSWAQSWGFDPITGSSIVVKLCWVGWAGAVLLILIWLMERALRSPWGRMMRAIRDNEVAAEAMGKDVTRRHLQIFVLGSAVCGLAGAMMTSLDGQLTPGSYQPLRFTFLIWLMVIVGGSGNNWGSILGGVLIWFLWEQGEPLGKALMDFITYPMPNGWWLKVHLLDSVQHMRLLTMGIILLVVLRFSPRGLIPER